MARNNDDEFGPAPRWAGVLHEQNNKVLAEVRRLREQVSVNQRRMERLMAKLDDELDELAAAAEAEDTKIDSLIELFKTAVKPLALTPEQQGKLDRALAAIRDNPDRIQAAIDANTEGTDPV